MANARRWSIDAAEDDDASARRRAEEAESSSGVGKGLGAAAVRGLAALDGAVDVHGDAKPAVVFVSGSGGVAGDTLRYLRMLAAAGTSRCARMILRLARAIAEPRAENRRRGISLGVLGRQLAVRRRARDGRAGVRVVRGAVHEFQSTVAGVR